jgi:hypothetical protein
MHMKASNNKKEKKNQRHAFATSKQNTLRNSYRQ